MVQLAYLIRESWLILLKAVSGKTAFNFGLACIMALAACLVFGRASLASPAGLAQLMAQAEADYQSRSDLARAAMAVDKYRRIIKLNPDDEKASLRLLRLLIWLGACKEDLDLDEAQEYYQQAITEGERAVKRFPGRPGPHYWLGVAYGLRANCSGPVTGLSLVDPIKDQMQRLMEIDPNYEYGGPYRVLGRLYTKLPGLLGGDNQKAEKLLRRAVKIGPGYWLNHLYLAEVLKEQGKLEEARVLVAMVKDGETLNGLEAESNLWKEVAADLLAKGAVR